MDMKAYLQAHDLTLAAFAGRIGVHPQAVHRYARGERIPERDVMRRIVAATGGAVTPNDFFGVPAARDVARDAAHTRAVSATAAGTPVAGASVEG